MSRLRVAPIVEGQGEEQSVRTLLQRVWCEVVGGTFLEVLKPIRGQRQALAGKNGLGSAVKYANLKLSAAVRSPSSGDPVPGVI